MSMQTNFAILRRDDRLVLTDEDRKAIEETLERYQKDFEYQVERAKELSTEYKGFGKVEPPKEPDIPEFIYLDETHWYNTLDKSVWINVYDTYYPSSFSDLADRWGVGMDGKKGQYFVSEAEAKELRAAAKYLANGNYDKAFEELLDTYFIETLSDLAPAYGNKGRNKKGLCLFVDKEREGCYKITDHEWEWGDADDDCDETWVLESIANVMSLYLRELNESRTYDGKKLYDVRLMYRWT